MSTNFEWCLRLPAKNREVDIILRGGNNDKEEVLWAVATKPVDSPFSTRITPDEELWKSMKLSDYIDLP